MIWKSLKSLCYDESHSSYKYCAKKKIKMCREWRSSFLNFFLDMGKRPAKGYYLNRKDKLKGFNKENCEWVLKRTNPTAKSYYKMITIDSETKCLKHWADIYNLPYHCVIARLKRNWPILKALETPKRK